MPIDNDEEQEASFLVYNYKPEVLVVCVEPWACEFELAEGDKLVVLAFFESEHNPCFAITHVEASRIDVYVETGGQLASVTVNEEIQWPTA